MPLPARQSAAAAGLASPSPAVAGVTARSVVVPITGSRADQPVGLVANVIELSKPRITRLVALTSGVGFVLSAATFAGLTNQLNNSQIGASTQLGANPWHAALTLDVGLSALGCIVGTVLAAGGANALNQWWERARDAKMPRTCGRPLPTGRISVGAALVAGLVMSLLGVGVLALLSGLAAALVALATILIYVLLYTPSKPLTPINTLIGAVPGALPPLIGWCAAHAAISHGATNNSAASTWHAALTGEASLGGWSLFALMFIWQLPHFMAIAWMYKDDYAAGGHRMLPWYDPTGRWTGVTIALTGLGLVPATLLPWLALRGSDVGTPTVLGWPYFAVAIVSGTAFAVLCLRLMVQALRVGLQRTTARTVFLASIVHLPLLLLAMVAEVLVRSLI